MILKFRSLDVIDQDDLHHRYQAKLKYRSKAQKVDVLRFDPKIAPGDRWGGDGLDSGWLKTLCTRYLKDRNVQRCGVDYALVENADPCPDLPLPALDTAVVERLQNTLDCKLFDSEYLAVRQPPVEAPGIGRVTRFHAQDLVGADLARKALDDWDSGAPPARRSRTVNVAAVDSGVDVRSLPVANLAPPLRDCAQSPPTRIDCPLGSSPWHGTQVAAEVVGRPPVGTGARARLSWVVVAESQGSLIRARDELLADAEPPRVVNISMGMVGAAYDATAREAVYQLAARTTLVQSAGNRYPAPLELFKTQTNGIVVADLSPNGLANDTSQAGPEVVIGAPSGEALTTFGRDEGAGPRARAFQRFGYTSGAAPLVTAAVSNAQSLLRSTTTEELKTLLRGTAIRTSAYRAGSGGGGAGSLNSYKLTRVVMRLAERGWNEPGSDHAALLADPSLTDFSAMAATKFRQAREGLEQVGCEAEREGLRLLREAYFLDPENVEIRAYLGRLYREYGLVTQAQFVEARSVSDTVDGIADPLERFLAGTRNGRPVEWSVRAFEAIAGEEPQYEAARYLFRVHGGAIGPALDRFLTSPNRDVRRAWYRDWGRGGLPPGQAAGVLERVFAVGDEEMRADAASWAARRERPPEGDPWPFVARALEDSEPVRHAIARYLNYLPDGPRCRETAERLSRDSSERIRALTRQSLPPFRCGGQSYDW